MKLSTIAAGALLLPVAGASAQGVTDAQIASIVVTANQVDIDAGKLARAMASNADVKKFADQMITDHTGVNKSAVDLVTKLEVTPEDNPTSPSPPRPTSSSSSTAIASPARSRSSNAAS